MALSEEQQRAHAGAVRGAPARLGARTRRCARSTPTGTGGSPPSCRRRRSVRASSSARGPGFARAVHPRPPALRHRARPLARSRGERRGAAVRRRQRWARWCCSTSSTTCRTPRRFFAEATRALRPGGRIVMCEPYVSPLSYPGLQVPPRRAAGAAGRSAGAGRQARAARAIRSTPTRRSRRCCSGAARRAVRRGVPVAGRSARRAPLGSRATRPPGGFSRRPLLPRPLWSALHAVEARLPEPLFRLIGFRMLVVIENAPSDRVSGAASSRRLHW